MGHFLIRAGIPVVLGVAAVSAALGGGLLWAAEQGTEELAPLGLIFLFTGICFALIAAGRLLWRLLGALRGVPKRKLMIIAAILAGPFAFVGYNWLSWWSIQSDCDLALESKDREEALAALERGNEAMGNPLLLIPSELFDLWGPGHCSSAQAALDEEAAPPEPVSLSAEEAKLYAIVVDQQRREAVPPRTVGDWPTEVKGSTYQSPDAESLFVPVEILLSLQRAARHRVLPGVSDLQQNSALLIVRYLEDSRRAKDPEGSVAFSPLQSIGPTLRRTHSSRFASGDLPPDLDDASRLALYLLGHWPQHPQIDATVALAGQYVDSNRPEQSEEEAAWKEPGSGAFLTWVENRPPESSRVPGGRPNDVDCVVGLNVLGMLARWKQVRQKPLPAATAAAEAATCKLLHRVIRSRLHPTCSLYYRRPAQFFWAASRAMAEGVGCLEVVRWRVVEPLLALARALPEGREQDHDAALLLLSIKLLHPRAARRAPELQALCQRLEARLRQRRPTAAPMFEGQGGALGPLHYSSEGGTAALVLEALVLP